MTPFLADPDVTLYQGDSLVTLRGFPPCSVHMACTSPPFYGLRDYNADGQIGLEATPQEWCDRLVEVFREVRRVLRDDGTLWVEIGDSYFDKQALGLPWLFAFALRADGWYLRSEIIWARPNPMPEPVTDRPTKAHSTVFLLSKRPRYFYDPEAIREPHTDSNSSRLRALHRNGEAWTEAAPGATDPASPYYSHRATRGSPGAGTNLSGFNPAGANARSVWTIPTEPTPFAHFATWPQALCRRMILAGCPESGTVLDPFGGSGTTAIVARKLGRRAILIELNADYCRLTDDRLRQQSLFAEVVA